MILIIKGFSIIVFIFIVISTTFRPIYPPAFFRWCRIRGPSRNFETTSFIEPTGIACFDSVNHKSVKYSCIVTHLQSGLNLQPADDCLLGEPMPLTVTLDSLEWIFETYKLNVLIWLGLLLLRMADHIWKEEGNHLPLWDEVEIIEGAEHGRIRRLKESAHMLGYTDLLSRPSIEINTIWKPITKKVR